VEDVAPARHAGQGLLLAGTLPLAPVGDGGSGVEAAIDQFQEAHAPGSGIATLLQAQQEAEGGVGITADQDRSATLEDLVQSSDADIGEILIGVVLLGQRHGASDDVMDVAHGDGGVEEVAEQFDDAAVGTVADEDQRQDQLPQPGLGDGEMEEDLIGGGFGLEGPCQGVPGDVGLLVEELAADLMTAGQVGDRMGRTEDLDGEILTLRRQQPLGGPRWGCGQRSEVALWEQERGRSLTIHACFLRVRRGSECPSANMEGTGILENPDSLSRLSPDVEPGPQSREVHCNTQEGPWASLRTALRRFYGVSKWYLAQYQAIFQWGFNINTVTDKFLRILLGVRPGIGLA
jgi:hypothetical protein